MTDQPPTEKPTRSKRMVLWLVAVPIVILLLALAGANWKFFHLAYAKHLISSDHLDKQCRGVEMVFQAHLRKGMTLEEVRAILAPARLTENGLTPPSEGPPLRLFEVYVESDPLISTAFLGFDNDDRLRWTVFLDGN